MHTSIVFSKKILNILSTILILFLGCKCNPSKNTQPKRLVKQFSEARREAEAITQLLSDDKNHGLDKDQKDAEIAKKWKETYIEYFEEKREEASDQYVQFLEYSGGVSSSPLLIPDRYTSDSSNTRRWYPLLIFRGAVTNTLSAIAQLDPSLEKEYQTAEQDIEKIKGGCDTGGCPIVNNSYVQPEMKKMERLLQSAKNMLNTIKNDNQQIYLLGHQAISVATDAINRFWEQTKNEKTGDLDINRIEAQRKAIFYEFVQSAALFTITLKELYEDRLASSPVH